MKKLLVALLSSLWVLGATAQTFPDKPVKIITSLPAGSGPDAVSRKLSERLQNKWKVPVVVENKPGGAGAVAFATYAEAPADGYTILSGDAGNFVGYPILYNRPQVLADIEPLTSQNGANMMLITAPNVKDMTDLKSRVEKKPVFAHGGVGSPMHLEGAELGAWFNIPVTHVPYKDYGAMWVDVSNGLVPYTFATIGSTQKLEEGGRLKYMAYAGNARHPDYPNVPTLNELTKQNRSQIRAWVVFYIKKNVPATIKSKLAKDIAEEMASREMQDMLKTLGYIYPPATPEALQKFVNGETAEFNRIVRKFNISVQ